MTGGGGGGGDGGRGGSLVAVCGTTSSYLPDGVIPRLGPTPVL